MLKGLSRLWWLGIKQVSKAQQKQSRKIVKSLLVKAPSLKKASVKPKPKRINSPRPTQSKPVPLITSQALPGKWLSSYYTAFPDGMSRPAKRMNYWLYLPQHSSSLVLPLVVMLHGCDQTASQFSQGTGMNRLAEEKGFAVLYPQQSLRGHPKRCWQWYDRETQEGDGDITLITGIIEAVIAKYAIDTSRIYAAGLSAGAAMAHILALAIPYRIAAVGLHSGPVFGAGHSPMGAYAVMQAGSITAATAINVVLHKSQSFPVMPAILIQGRNDRVVRSINQAQLAQQFRILNRLDTENALPIVLKTGRPGSKTNPSHSYLIQDYQARRKLLLRVCEIEHLDHAWSGGDSSLQYNDHAGPNATKMIWDFFARHHRAVKPFS